MRGERAMREGAKVSHKKYGTGVVQPLLKNLHPNMPEDMCFVKFDVWPKSLEGELMGVDVLQVFNDELTEIE
jgi:hypothetical protein